MEVVMKREGELKYTYESTKQSFCSPAIHAHGVPGFYDHSPLHIFEDIVEHCCKAWSLNELRALAKYGGYYWLFAPREIRDMIKEVKRVIAKREKQTPYHPQLTVRYDRSSCSGLRVKFFGSEHEEWISQTILDYSVNKFTANELAEIIRQFDQQLSRLSPDDRAPNQTNMLEALKKAYALRKTETSSCSCVSRYSAKGGNIRAILKRELGAGAGIKVTGLAGNNTKDLYGDIVEHCGMELSKNELREVLKQVYDQLNKMEVDDIPLTFIEVLHELEQALKARK
jgi:hypothetical protein